MYIAHRLKELELFLEKWRLHPAQRYANGGVVIHVDRRYVVSLRPKSTADLGGIRTGRIDWLIEARLARLSQDATRRARQIADSASFGLGLVAYARAAITIDHHGTGLWLRQFIADPADCERIESAFETFCDALELWSSHHTQRAPLPQGVARTIWA